MTKEQFMIEEISKEIVLLLMEEHQMDMREALKALYTSDTYSRLINLDTGLYAQSTIRKTTRPPFQNEAFLF